MINNKAYVALDSPVFRTDIAGSPASVNIAFIILAADDTLAAFSAGANPGQTVVPLHYGDSEEAIRESVATALRTAAGDPHLDVNFLPS